jgi:hypothetical protein
MRFRVGAPVACAFVSSFLTLNAEAMPNDWTTVFECGVGNGKMVTVRAMNDGIIYEYGTDSDKSLTIQALVSDGSTVLYRAARYAGMEQQWRFKHQGYSYIVYEMAANGDIGTSSGAGLIILNGKHIVARKTCHTRPRMDAYDPSNITADTEAYSVMSVGD